MSGKRYKLTISYDGSTYAGWQVQPQQRTVQGELERVLAELTGEHAKVHGSGRTDRGVHAKGQVAHLDLAGRMPPAALAKGLNALLPVDIRVTAARLAAPSFHARRSAIGKEYRYFIWDADVVPPFLRLYRAHVRSRLDVAAMSRAAAGIRGRHDFAALTANPNRVVESTVRTVSMLTVRRRGSEVVITACADGFLYKMVRSIAGILIRVGEGTVPPGEIRAILRSRTRTARVPTAPPHGLFLWRVMYPHATVV
ncbi:MAG: tRNA pseudouridine(38-40) synthase TruA [Kiritimatiellae bacterium]|nr:tRNA pseudouridine(38-40) synthase TruA [Kiritimatiellia bacterium]